MSPRTGAKGRVGIERVALQVSPLRTTETGAWCFGRDDRSCADGESEVVAAPGRVLLRNEVRVEIFLVVVVVVGGRVDKRVEFAWMLGG